MIMPFRHKSVNVMGMRPPRSLRHRFRVSGFLSARAEDSGPSALPAVFALGVVVVGFIVDPSRAFSDDDAAVKQYASKIRPLMAQYCYGCHGAKTQKSGLDLERFTTLDQLRADIAPWPTVLEMLESNEMPPPKKEPRIRPAARRALISWIRTLLADEARRRAGDPGPVMFRRLNNAEFTRTIQDLTGVDLQPAAQFPADGAAGEGFLNAGDALGISSELVTKYLAAAKRTAEHTVLLPNGFRFSSSRFREDWVNEVLEKIRALYAEYATDLGGIPLVSYLQATLSHRDALRAGTMDFPQIGDAEQLSPKYLEILWRFLNDDQPSPLLDKIRARWRALVAPSAKTDPSGVSSLAAEIRTLQGLVWHKQEPTGERTLDDRYVPAAVTITDSHRYELKILPAEQVVFYIAGQVINGGGNGARVVLHQPRFRSESGDSLLLRDALRRAAGNVAGPTKVAPPVKRLDISRFGLHPENKLLDETSLMMQADEVLEVRLPIALVVDRTFVVDASVDPANPRETLVQLDVRTTAASPQVDRSLAWQYREQPSGPPLLTAHVDESVRAAVASSAEEFRQVFPARLCYPGVIVRDATVTLERFHRGDRFLSRLMLNPRDQRRLDLLWKELHYISRDAIQVRDSFATLIQGEKEECESLRGEVVRRAAATVAQLLASESKHLESLSEFAARAYRRPLTAPEQRGLLDLYDSLRQAELPHSDAVRSVLARVLVSPSFLYRIEQSQPGSKPTFVNGWELATRLSYFLWSSTPDEELRALAEEKRLQQPAVLVRQIRRMLRDPRSRALSVEFGTQWLEVRGFDRFEGKNQELFPSFNADLRQAMYEESILLFQDLFRHDRPLEQLIDAEFTFLNSTLASHYGIPDVQGKEFRRVNGVKPYGRGGILALASVLAKHSGASRTSPVLRGNWIAEILLGEKLPRPPDDVPKLPEHEAGAELTIRQLVERHAEVEQCAVCHRRIDPLGFALEQYDTIGRKRSTDLGGKPIDDAAQLSEGIQFTGIEGLKHYLLTQRREDFVRQFARKLLGYALGRRIRLADRLLLARIETQMEANDNRIFAAVETIVLSDQFRKIRGRDYQAP